MIRLADVIKRYRSDLLSEYAEQMLPSHYRALDAIVQCRTLAIGNSLWHCDDCDHSRILPLSCGHRHCPSCQNYESAAWIQRQLDKQLPANYFLLTFTVPRELRATVYCRLRDQWNVHCQPAGKGEQAIKYLARYLYRNVVDERRILSMDSGEVVFEYVCSETKSIKRHRLPAVEFLWNLLSHVLPRGFQRARAYGLLHHNCAVLLRRLQLILHAKLPTPKPGKPRHGPKCTKCQCAMTLKEIYRAPLDDEAYLPARASPQVAIE